MHQNAYCLFDLYRWSRHSIIVLDKNIIVSRKKIVFKVLNVERIRLIAYYAYMYITLRFCIICTIYIAHCTRLEGIKLASVSLFFFKWSLVMPNALYTFHMQEDQNTNSSIIAHCLGFQIPDWSLIGIKYYFLCNCWNKVWKIGEKRQFTEKCQTENYY